MPDLTPSTDPMAIYAFRQSLRNAKRRAKAYPTRVVDRTAQFSAPLLRRLRMGLTPRPRGEGIELSNLPA